jgi:hypothetical protein
VNSTSIFGAFITAASLADHHQARELISTGAAAGITHVFVETRTLPSWLPALCDEHGLKLVASLPCFFEDDLPTTARAARATPLNEHGQPRPKLEWYTGTLPSDEAAVAALVPRAMRLLDSGNVDGLCLDFIRWPQHWELELRDDGPYLGTFSFDSATVAAFNRSSGLNITTTDPVTSATTILSTHQAEWHEFRTAAVTRIATHLAEVIRTSFPSIWVGAFLVPLTEEERRHAVGQSAAQLGQRLDVLLPMAYHAIIQRTPELALTLRADARAAAPGPGIVPIVQTTANRRISNGWDWGAGFEFTELEPTLHELARNGEGFVLFPAEGLTHPDWRIIAQILADSARAAPLTEQIVGSAK